MEKLIKVLEKYLVPVAAKVGSQRHLVSIRDSFVALMPITLAGSVAVLLNILFRDMPPILFGEEASAGFVESMQWLIDLNGLVWWGTISMLALIFTFALGYNLAKNSNIDALPAGIVSTATFLISIPQVAKIPESIVAIDQTTNEAVTTIWGNLSSSYTGATGLFTAIFIVLIVMEIYIFLMKRNITIKMPDSVPPAVGRAFTSVIPGIVAIYTSAIIVYLFEMFMNMPINDFISNTIQAPLISQGSSYGLIMFITFLQQLLWFVGMHGSNILTPVYESIWGVASVLNIEAFAAGQPIPHLWSRGSFDVYGAIGGAGMSLALVVSMLKFGKNSETKEISKIGLLPGVFNVNEPIVFGVPIILNPMFLIPWVFIPMITISIGYFATILGFAKPVVASVPWVLPGVFSAFFATGGDLMATLVALICFVVAVVLWMPFVIAAERINNKKYED